jgi:uncharacterized lipoprotein YddW (UPF0748 family)
MRTSLPKIVAASGLAVALALSAGCAGRRAPAPIPSAAAPQAEIRALWVDEFHAGIRTREEADQLVAAAQRANLNTLFVQVRGRGDALYTQGSEPPREDPAYDPQFDALQNIIDAAHRANLEVHAWINAMPIWGDPTPPRDPRHVFVQHGPGQTGDADWLTRSPHGETRFPVGYFLDPGHPAAAAYLAEVYLNIVRHYAVDGIHFDYIRYPETEKSQPRGAPVGYNATSLERFRRVTGRQDTPAPDDPEWTAWRRQQVTQLVRRVYLEAKGINPKIKVSAAVIAWGKPPRSGKDFEDASPMQRIFQDWRGWLQEGILDLAVPMNYARESDPVVCGWFDGWLRWEKRNKRGRQVVVGLGAYLNPAASTLAQIGRARQPDGNRRTDGVSLFSYAVPSASPPSGQTSSDATPQTLASPEDPTSRLSFLTTGTDSVPAAFPQPAGIPKMGWIEQPAEGHLEGIARDAQGAPADGMAVELKHAGWFGKTRRTVTDGNGFFGFANLPPGRYRARLRLPTGRGPTKEVEISAGRVARVELIQP